MAFITTYHPHEGRKPERVNMILEYMLTMYAMHQQRKWEYHLPLEEFFYNSEYHEYLRMSPFEALYGQSCNTIISWSDLVNRIGIGPNMLEEMEQEMQVIEMNLKATRDMKKDLYRSP